MPYPFNINIFRAIPSCKDYTLWNIEGVYHCDVQGKLQWACTGSPHLFDPFGNEMAGPVHDLAKCAPDALNWITQLNNAGEFERADRLILELALDLGLVVFSDEDLKLPREFAERVSQQHY
jgi:hypothetical protein